MPLFLWKKSYEIGIEVIDEQHRQLVAIINELSDAMMSQTGYRSAPHILEQLVDYIQLHFTTEEKIMRDTQYPALEAHCQEHLVITNTVLAFKAEYSTNHAIKVIEVLNFLCDWLKNHIAVSDKELKVHIKGEKATTPSLKAP